MYSYDVWELDNLELPSSIQDAIEEAGLATPCLINITKEDVYYEV